MGQAFDFSPHGAEAADLCELYIMFDSCLQTHDSQSLGSSCVLSYDSLNFRAVYISLFPLATRMLSITLLI